MQQLDPPIPPHVSSCTGLHRFRDQIRLRWDKGLKVEDLEGHRVTRSVLRRDAAIQTPAPVGEQWLTLEQASKRLGVHSSTLRRWSNEGAITAFLTPGGHRRFLLSDIDQLHRKHSRTRLPAYPVSHWGEHAITQARQDAEQQRWLAVYDEEEREVKRQLGRRLIGLLLQYVGRPDESQDLLAEARTIGGEHARGGLRTGRSLVDMLAAVTFFRTTLLEVALLENPSATALDPQASSRLLRRIERLLGEMQSGIVEIYMARTSATCE
jgi:excisionase family DNA binding protein